MDHLQSSQQQLEITLLKRDLLEQQDKTSTLQLENTRLENEIRELKRRLTLFYASAETGFRATPLELLSGNSDGISDLNSAEALGGENENPEPSMGNEAIIDLTVSSTDADAVPNNPQRTAEEVFHVASNGSKALVPSSPMGLRAQKRKAEPASPTLPTTPPNPKRTKTNPTDLSAERKNISSLELEKFSKVNVSKDKAFMLSESRGRGYLQDASTLSINPPPSSTTFTRQFLSEIHGGSVQEFLAYSTNKSRLFIFPTADVNPWMPTSPGSPGLLLSSRKGMLGQQVTLLSRVQKAPAKWMYFGEYQCTVVGKLTPQEFSQQRQKVKNAWATKLLKVKKWPEYAEMRSRMLSKKTQRVARSSSSVSLTPADVIAALEAGEEQIDVVRMNCVVYDHEFAQDLTTKLGQWAPAPKKKTGAASSSRKNGSGRARGRQPDSTDEDSDSDED
ncbi:hypothetical protein H0H93_013435 [Arthromyces matolae]|nr:hypothetical protein H0H93_013435 [Arthromyces matolae]